MKKQNARNNDFLRKAKALYNEPTYKSVLAYVNEGNQTLAEFLLGTGLIWYVNGEKAARILLKAGYRPHPNQSAGDLIKVAKQIERF